ncbi:hypothetical protein V1277_000004 [Bradyrhizobium sp. AZCC 1588]|uniref:hypothetical protein n=1 Tax=unclassified Bradyrhizobium TaxID=2631580 RepID=UPI002FF136FE
MAQRSVGRMTSIIPRQNQIKELVGRLELPLAALDVEHLRVIAEVIERAWLELCTAQAVTIATGTEAEINALLATKLNALLDIDPLWSQLVRSVTRGSESISFDGSHLEKRPDLSIHLTGRNPSFPLTIECKIVDAAGQKSVGVYCNTGLKRFLNGEYAWAAREAFMLGYVRDGSSIAISLAPLLTKSKRGKPNPFGIGSVLAPLTLDDLDGAHSHHSRSFKYLIPANKNPGPIGIWHLWMTGNPV